MEKKLTQEELKSILEYNPETGIFRWIKCRFKKRIGKEAGGTNKAGYRIIRIKGKMYLAHRLAWLYMEGYFPENCVDHINRDKLNNRWTNLRETSYSCNNRNTKRKKNNTSGITGVFWVKQRNRWNSSIRKNGKAINLGYFKTKKEAALARYEAEKQNGYLFCDKKTDSYMYLKNKNLI